MQKKFCACCKKEKGSSEFYLKGNGRLHSWCNDCRKNKKKEWDLNNKDHIDDYKQKNHEYALLQAAAYREANREKLREQSVVYNERLREKRKQDRLKPENRVREVERRKKWQKENRERYNAYFKDYFDKDESKKIGRNLRNRLRKMLVGENRSLKTKEIAGCSLDFLKTHLESLFQDGMQWSNYGEWHIDHYLPCRAFDLKLPLHQKACFFWLNLRPMWGPDNISKNDNYFTEEFDAYMEWFTEKQY